ncbi:MAG TPA: hypothetical protein VF701_15155 [Thermoanaerobaculia bacterium]
MTLIPLAASLVLLLFAVLLSMNNRQESLVSLTAGAVSTLLLGMQELWAAIAPGVVGNVQALHVAASVGFTATAALFARLAVRNFQTRRVAQ